MNDSIEGPRCSKLTFVASCDSTARVEVDHLRRVREPVSRSKSGVQGKVADVANGRSRHAESQIRAGSRPYFNDPPVEAAQQISLPIGEQAIIRLRHMVHRPGKPPPRQPCRYRPDGGSHSQRGAQHPSANSVPRGRPYPSNLVSCQRSQSPRPGAACFRRPTHRAVPPPRRSQIAAPPPQFLHFIKQRKVGPESSDSGGACK